MGVLFFLQQALYLNVVGLGHLTCPVRVKTSTLGVHFFSFRFFS